MTDKWVGWRRVDDNLHALSS